MSQSPERREEREEPREAAPAPTDDAGSKLFVANLTYNTRDRDLEDVFSKFGRVKEVHVAEDRNSGRSKGFAFVTMADSQGANDAIAGANGIEIDGRPIKVELSTGPPARNPDAARRGPREGGRGGGGRSDVCYDWQSGRCSRGTSCRFSHDDGSSRGRDRSRDRDGYRGRSRDRDSRRDDYRRDDRGSDRRDDRGGDRRDDRDRDYRGGRSDPYERRDGGRDRERSRDRY